MSDAPPLPDSNDPFEVLGVSPDVDQVALRRAYVRLIRIHRPDRDPQAFARVRSAYEAAQRMLAWRSYQLEGADVDGEDPQPASHADGDEVLADVPAADGDGAAAWRALPEAEADSPPEPAAGDDPIPQRIAAAWRGLAAGAAPEVLLLPLQEPWDDERLALHRTLIVDAAGIGLREHVLAGLRRGVPMAGWLGVVLTDTELADLVMDDAFVWASLRRQGARGDAAQLMRARLHVLMARGHLDRAVEQVLDEPFVRDAELLPLLGWAGQEVLAVAAWAGVPELDHLDRVYGVHGADDSAFLSPSDHRAAADALREPWLAWRREFGTFRELRQFFVLAPVLGGPPLLDVTDRLAADFLQRAGKYAACFTRMGEAAPELLERFILAAQSVVGPEEQDDAILADPGLRVLERDADALGASGHRAAPDTYDSLIRPTLTRLVVLNGISPRGLLAAMQEVRTALPCLRRYADQIRGEHMLRALHACRRLTLAPEA